MAQDKAVGTYNPNGPAAIFAFLLFGGVDVILFLRYFNTRPRAKYMRAICVGCFFMCLGFIIRFTRRNGITAWAFIFETLCLLLSPCAFLAQIYVLLPRLSAVLDADDCLWFPKKGIVSTFICADIVTVLGQIAGVALQATFGYLIGIGVKVTMASLLVQLVVFLLFVSVFVMFGKRIGRSVHIAQWHECRFRDVLRGKAAHWKALYYALGFASACMIIRTGFRCVEYAAGGSSSFSDNEIVFYILDAIPMLLFVCAFALVWPPQCLESSNSSRSCI